MACSCGSASTKPGTAAKTIEGMKYTLEYWACSACGRVGGDVLKGGGSVVSCGPRARHDFQYLERKTPAVPGPISVTSKPAEPEAILDGDQWALF
jgi:hypothetical protein